MPVQAEERTSGLVLRAARVLVTVVALLCFAAFVVVAIAVIGYEVASVGPARTVAVPPPYTAAPPSIDAARIVQEMAAPTGITFVPAAASPGWLAKGSAVLGRLTAEAHGGMAEFPDAFRIVGGTGAAYVDITPQGVIGTFRLRRRVKRDLARPKPPATLRFTLRVVASNRFGVSSRQLLAVSLPYAPAQKTASLVPSAKPSPEPARPAAALTQLELIARRFALAVDPGRTPLFFRAYQMAYALPARCHAAGSKGFLNGFQSALAKAGPLLNANVAPGFLKLVCLSWTESIQRQQRLAVRAERARHDAVMRQNALYVRTQEEEAAARVRRDSALVVLAGVLGTFLVVALVLAFLAIEHHTRTLGTMVKRLTERDPTAQTGAQP